MQRFDGLDPAFLWQLNAKADRPDLAVILTADPEVIAQRLRERGAHNRFQLSPDSSQAEVGFYREATDQLDEIRVRRAGPGRQPQPARQSAALIAERLLTLLAMRRMCASK